MIFQLEPFKSDQEPREVAGWVYKFELIEVDCHGAFITQKDVTRDVASMTLTIFEGPFNRDHGLQFLHQRLAFGGEGLPEPAHHLRPSADVFQERPALDPVAESWSLGVKPSQPLSTSSDGLHLLRFIVLQQDGLDLLPFDLLF